MIKNDEPLRMLSARVTDEQRRNIRVFCSIKGVTLQTILGNLCSEAKKVNAGDVTDSILEQLCTPKD